MLQTLKGEKTSEYFFMTYGGKQTIESYYGDIHNIMNIHGNFYNNLKLYYETDKFFFVHGGINPQKSFEEQDIMDFVMIREQFIDFPHNLKGKKVIFGHTPFSKPLICDDKIGIDTGCGKYEDAKLTAYICNTDEFVQV
jgi:serine/threonine protein phosphatase 1